jgi:hypothetical protein
MIANGKSFFTKDGIKSSVFIAASSCMDEREGIEQTFPLVQRGAMDVQK